MTSPPQWMAQLNLFIVLNTKAAINSLTDSSPFVFPALQEGDTPSLAITVLRQIAPNFATTPYEIVNPASYTLRAGLFVRASPYTTLTYLPASSFTVDATNQRQTAILDLATSAIDTATAAGDVSNCRWEVEMTEIPSGAVDTIYRLNNVDLLKDYLSNALTTVAPSELAASQAFVRNGFVPKFATELSARFEMDADGKLWRITRGTDGQELSELYVP